MTLIIGSVACDSVCVAQKKSDKKQGKRVTRPEFKKEDWQDVFFEDLFTEGLSGDRPVKQADKPEDKPEATAVHSTQLQRKRPFTRFT